MGFMSAVESGTYSLGQFVHGQGTIRFENTTLGMEPLRFNGIEPGTLDGQRANQQANALSRTLDLLIMLTDPLSHSLTAMPGGIIPNQGQHMLAEGLDFVAQPGQEILGEGADRPPVHKAQPDLLGFIFAHQEAVTSQRFGLLVRGGFNLLNQAQGLFLLCPGIQLGLLKTTPPRFIFKAQHPVRMSQRQADQPVACVFLRAYAGSGLVIQSLARCQRTPSRSRAIRTVSSLTRSAVKPCSKLTCAASSSLQTLVCFPYLRGLSCSSPFRRSAPSSLKALWTSCGRLERRANTARPCALKARITSRTVSSLQPSACAIAGARSPRLLLNTIWLRRKTNAEPERSPASNWFRSSGVSSRTKIGGLIRPDHTLSPFSRLPVRSLH